MESRRYPTDLSDTEWRCIRPHLPKPTGQGRPRLHSLRAILDAVFYVLKSGCPWRMLPRDFPPWKTVYDWFRRWRIDSTFERLNAELRELLWYRRFRGEAAFGKDTLLRQTFYGFRVHTRVCWPGLISRISVAPSNVVHELSVLPELVQFTRSFAVGDRNYWSPETREVLARSIGVELLAPYRTKKRDPAPPKKRSLEPPALPDRHRLFAAHRKILRQASVGQRPLAPTWPAGCLGRSSATPLPFCSTTERVTGLCSSLDSSAENLHTGLIRRFLAAIR